MSNNWLSLSRYRLGTPDLHVHNTRARDITAAILLQMQYGLYPLKERLHL